MDWKQAWSTTTTTTNTALDALAPMCAPFAARWDREAERRAQLRTPENLKALMAAQREHNSARSTAAMARNQRSAARKASNNPLSATRRAARTAHNAARQHHSQARAGLKAARKNHPATLRTLAVQAHAAHTVPSSLATWLMSEAGHTLTLWPASVSAGLIGLHAAGLWLGRRQPSVRLDDGMTAEERRLALRLDPSFWVQNADARGLSGTVPTPAKLTPAGLVSHVRLDGRWTPKTFRAKADEVRALLGARTDLRMEITSGSHGDRATITLRTRSAADGIDLTGWEPGAPWGIDTVTGELVMVPLGRRMLVAGTSGSGKSWSTRALLAEGSEAADHRLVVIDPKRVEAMNWQHRARTAITPDEVLDVSDELVEEMHDRLQLVPRGRDVIEISPEHPRITVFVDEGAEVISMSRTRGKSSGDEDTDAVGYGRIMENFRTLARMARAAEIILIWATQKPTMDRNGGIDPQISAQITYRAALALSTSGESRVVFGEDATEKGWHAHELPMPGVAMLRSGPKAKPHPISTRAFSPADVIALPERPIWKRESSRPTRSTLHLVKQPTTPTDSTASAPTPAAAETNRDRVLRAVHDGARTLRDITDRTGINKGTVSREVKALTGSGALRKTDDGMLQPGREAA
ncbi:FtsK/SpoIIIE domain-containing protein [Streptomyces sp. RB6PN25]|uniref:FtsK/SpoIIIE domain-containing protein n=1 Tax=Streptomyces humicola TaxID=2953240 RepID=A0ABT1PZ69_9ACTN|nr:FtsK/SpoIIIE domain-containing protein [Streptomyces humicola]MCQ4082952.1 FtsK/SpoIIIE domain-containing protein [Streptomyces humicola]